MATNHLSVEAVNSTILTKKEAAAFLRCTTRYIERVVRQGRLKAYRPTLKLVRFKQADLLRFLESGASIGSDV
jgi:excisionase family DNA binding protein